MSKASSLQQMKNLRELLNVLSHIKNPFLEAEEFLNDIKQALLISDNFSEGENLHFADLREQVILIDFLQKLKGLEFEKDYSTIEKKNTSLTFSAWKAYTNSIAKHEVFTDHI